MTPKQIAVLQRCVDALDLANNDGAYVYIANPAVVADVKAARVVMAHLRKEARLAAIDRRIAKETGKSLLQTVGLFPFPRD